MKTALILAAVSAAVVTTACHAASAPAVAARQQQCRAFADRQFGNLGPGMRVSGTAMTYIYDDKSGFCTVEIKNRDKHNPFYSKVSTNTFDVTSTMPVVNIQRFVAPMPVVWRPAPQALVCDKVTRTRDGKLLCDPHKPADEDMLDPFFPWGW
jgi:hypothetical protein